MAQPLEDDTLEKIHSYVKDMDINGTYVDMTEQLLMFRPENPIRFMVDYLSHKHKEQVRCYHLSHVCIVVASIARCCPSFCCPVPRLLFMARRLFLTFNLKKNSFLKIG